MFAVILQVTGSHHLGAAVCVDTVQSMNKFNRPHLKQHNGFLCHKRNKFKCV